MPILHKNITAETDIHNPKWFSNANNGDYAWKNEQGNLESIDELLLPAALNFVDGSVAPPTSNAGDIYVLSSGGSVDAGWGSVSINDWVRYDGAAWNAITPQKSSLCYNETSNNLLSFNGVAWAGLGGDSIYTADDTIGSARVATLTDTITFKGHNTSLGQRNLIIRDSNNDYILENFNNGFFKRTIRSGANLGVISNSAATQGLWLQTVSELAGAGGLLIKNSKADTNYLKYFTDNFKAPDAQWYSNGQIHHRIRSNGTSSTVLSQASFFTQGFSGFGFNVGAAAPVGSENISLQGSTLIKGEGTTTGTTLALYDDDTTPNKTWEWLDNGNVNIGQNSTFDLDLNILTFDVGTFGPGSGVDKGIVIDGSNYQITNTGATNAFFEVINQNGIVFNALQRGGILSYSDVNPLASLIDRGNTKGLRLDTNNSRLSTNELIFNNSFTGNQGIYFRGSGTTNDFFFRDSSNVIQHWLRQGDSLAQATFFRAGMNGQGFTIGGSSPIGSEDISLQGDTLLNANVNMANLPTSSAGLSSGDVWNDSGTLKIV